MAYTEPKTWSNEPLVASDLNTHLRDNMDEIKNPPDEGYIIDDAVSWTVTSTTFLDVDANDFATTLTTNGGDLLVSLTATFAGSAAINLHLALDLDGTQITEDDGMFKQRLATSDTLISFTYWIRDLSAGEHTVKLQWKTSSGTITLHGGQAGSGLNLHGQWNVREVS